MSAIDRSTAARASGSLRGVLDAALSSPSRRGVVVDDSGALVGTVLAHEVLSLIESADRPDVDQPNAHVERLVEDSA